MAHRDTVLKVRSMINKEIEVNWKIVANQKHWPIKKMANGKK